MSQQEGQTMDEFEYELRGYAESLNNTSEFEDLINYDGSEEAVQQEEADAGANDEAMAEAKAEVTGDMEPLLQQPENTDFIVPDLDIQLSSIIVTGLGFDGCLACGMLEGMYHSAFCPFLVMEDGGMAPEQISTQESTVSQAHIPAMPGHEPLGRQAQPTRHGTTDAGPPNVHQAAQASTHAAPRTPAAIRFNYGRRFNSFEDAHAALAKSSDQDPIVPLDVHNDDWYFIKTGLVHAEASRLHTALYQPVTEPPEVFTDFAKQYYLEHQASTLISIQAGLKNEPETAEAHILIALEEVIKLHETGVPHSVLTRTSLRQGFKLEQGMTCSQRINKIITCATKDKYFAHDILTGNKLQDLVRSPSAYFRRKVDNSRVNAKKAFDKDTMIKTQDKSTSAKQIRTPAAPRAKMEPHAGLGAKGRTNKRQRMETPVVDEEGHEEDVALYEPQTPTPGIGLGISGVSYN